MTVDCSQTWQCKGLQCDGLQCYIYLLVQLPDCKDSLATQLLLCSDLTLNMQANLPAAAVNKQLWDVHMPH